jgi:hypothetical protein
MEGDDQGIRTLDSRQSPVLYRSELNHRVFNTFHTAACAIPICRDSAPGRHAEPRPLSALQVEELCVRAAWATPRIGWFEIQEMLRVLLACTASIGTLSKNTTSLPRRREPKFVDAINRRQQLRTQARWNLGLPPTRERRRYCFEGRNRWLILQLDKPTHRCRDPAGSDARRNSI